MSEFLVRCPYHHDEHPSASISIDKMLWWCYACQRGGQLYDFLRDSGFSVKQTVSGEALTRLLADQPGHGAPAQMVSVIPHGPEFWWKVTPSRFGAGYAVWRSSVRALQEWGVGYSRGYILFPLIPKEKLVCQMREAWPGGRYWTVCTPGPRRIVWAAPGASRYLIVEGPMDALSLTPLVDLEEVGFIVLAGSVPKEFPRGELVAWVDGDRAGDLYLAELGRRCVLHRVITSPGKDPSDLGVADRAVKLAEAGIPLSEDAEAILHGSIDSYGLRDLLDEEQRQAEVAHER
jgi:hypothetical protein